ncbi:hypothetical protein EDEG_02372, partial [Edhazardia aedis USNM 41457]
MLGSKVVISFAMFIISSISAAAPAGGYGILVKGADGCHPSQICRRAGYMDALATVHNMPVLKTLLEEAGVPSAYVAGWHDQLDDFVVHHSGTVTPHHSITNATAHAFCVKPHSCEDEDRAAYVRDYARRPPPVPASAVARDLRAPAAALKSLAKKALCETPARDLRASAAALKSLAKKALCETPARDLRASAAASLRAPSTSSYIRQLFRRRWLL